MIGNLKENDAASLLKEAVRRGIIDLEDVRSNIEMTKRTEILQAHKKSFTIWQGTNGYWYTYLPDEAKKDGRRLVKKRDEEKLHQTIFDFYKVVEKKSIASISSLYSEWLAFKGLHTNSTSYIRRIDNDWNAYYKGTAIISIPLTKLDFITLDSWAHSLVKDRQLTKTKYYNITVIIRQLMDYAVSKGLLERNIFKDVKIKTKLFSSNQKPEDSTQVFLTTEMPLISEEAYKDFEENGHRSSAPLAVPFLFQTGMRLGELVALKASDISGNRIHIQRMAVRYQEQDANGNWLTAKYIVVEHTKSEAGNRWVYLSEEARRIVQMVLNNNEKHSFSDDDFLFLDRKGRISARAVDTRIRKYCSYAGISTRSCHKIRKTYVSNLIDSGLNINEIRKQVGHTDEKTTYKNYCFNRLSADETENALEQALRYS